MAFGGLDPRASLRFDAAGQAAISRVYARDAALRIASDGLRLVCGSSPDGAADAGPLATDLRLPAIHAAQAGLLTDLDVVADELYGRTDTRARASA
jgi:hypothetical protein